MRIAVYGENSSERRLLCGLLQQQASECRTEQYANEEELIADIEDDGRFDIVLLSVDRSGFSVLELARRLRRSGYNGEIVLLSGDAMMAVDGYEVGVSGFLLKPISPKRLIRLIDRLVSRDSEGGFLVVSHHGTVVRIPYDRILYIESNNSKCIIHLQNMQQYTVYRRLGELEEALHDERFLRCHQSYLVNMDHIVKAHRQFDMIDGTAVCIRQRDVRLMKEHFATYMHRRHHRDT